jgi:Putative adhesin
MPTFDTPEPISVSVELGVGDIQIDATDRIDTVVEVRPSDPTKKADVAAAEQTRVEYLNGHLVVSVPTGWRQWMPHRGGESVDVSIALPHGSALRAEVGVASLRSSGRLGECRCKAGVGDIYLDEVGAVELKTGAGDIAIERAVGRAEAVTGTGAIRIGRIDGAAAVKNGNGDTWIGEIAGEARVSAGNGAITIDVAREGVVAKSAKGDVRLGDVARGAAVAQSAFGALEVGVHDGVAAWLDLHTRFGHVQNDLEASGSPEPGADTVEVHASTSYGDITIHRSTVSQAGRSV